MLETRLLLCIPFFLWVVGAIILVWSLTYPFDTPSLASRQTRTRGNMPDNPLLFFITVCLLSGFSLGVAVYCFILRPIWKKIHTWRTK